MNRSTKSRFLNLGIAALIVLVGGVLNGLNLMPAFLMDFLYAMLIFFILRLILLGSNGIVLGIITMFLCYLFEFTNIFDPEFLSNVKEFKIAEFSLTKGFMFTSLIYYLIGVITAAILDSRINK